MSLCFNEASIIQIINQIYPIIFQMASLSVACSDMRYVHGRAQHSALWMTTEHGDIFSHDADQYQLNELPSEM